MMKKVLMIAYYTPPLGMSGGMRVAKFAKYLPQFGWQPVILTVKPIAYYHYDYELLSDLKHVRIYRSESLDPNRLLYRFGQRKPKYKPGPGCLFLNLNYLLFPDAKALWAPFAYSLGKKIIRAESPDLIFATAPPYTSLLLGLLLKKVSGLPLVCDFRDPWPTGPVPPPSFQRAEILALRNYLIAGSDAQIFAHQEVIDQIGQGVLIRNGYDPQDFMVKPLQIGRNNGVYAGNALGNETEISSLLEAVDEVGKLKIHFAGIINPNILEKIKTCKNAKYWGILSHSQAIRLMKGADFLLYFPKPSEHVAYKLYEYIGVQKPVLAISQQETESTHFITENKIGLVVPSQKKAVKSALLTLIKRKNSYKFLHIEQYGFLFQTRKLAQIFDMLL
jgi:hypothetical protein